MPRDEPPTARRTALLRGADRAEQAPDLLQAAGADQVRAPAGTFAVTLEADADVGGEGGVIVGGGHDEDPVAVALQPTDVLGQEGTRRTRAPGLDTDVRMNSPKFD
ncbi:hypothetical protein ACGFNU_39665 [Spirillospora sp. NPDC048911]|uniref:hypothetical protein n=1 Tax=Spirillospora sp. NPDC048911 TaxID=3364527 RepID=UPI003713A8D6